jgi:hypothetical protein
MDTIPHGDSSEVSGRPAGITLAAGSLLVVLFMAMHPTGHGHAGASLLEHLMQDRNAIVHGVLIALMVPVLVGFVAFAARLGLHRLWALTGLVLYGIGILAGMSAALVNGFIVPAVAAHFASHGDAGVELATPSLVLCHAVNTACAQVDVIGVSAAAVFWGCGLLRRQGLLRAVGALGIVCGAVPLLALALGRLPMDLHGFGAFILMQTVWGLGVAAALIRRRV